MSKKIKNDTGTGELFGKWDHISHHPECEGLYCTDMPDDPEVRRLVKEERVLNKLAAARKFRTFDRKVAAPIPPSVDLRKFKPRCRVDHRFESEWHECPNPENEMCVIMNEKPTDLGKSYRVRYCGARPDGSAQLVLQLKSPPLRGKASKAGLEQIKAAVADTTCADVQLDLL